MSILLTGAQGFIGRAVRTVLRQEGYDVLSVDLVGLSPGPVAGGCEIPLDITDAERVRELFQTRGIAGIIHLAAILPTASQHEPLRATQVNVVASTNLLELSREFGVRRFVFGSSLSVYGTCPADQIVSEDRPPTPEDLYAASKLYVEQLGATYRDCFGLEFVSLRIGRVVGPGARSDTSAWRSQIFEFLHAEETAEIAIPYIDSERILLVHVDDVARALVALMRAKHLVHSVYNAPCDSVLVRDLKREVEGLNSLIKVSTGEEYAKGNPRLVEWTRFRKEFQVRADSVMNQLRRGGVEEAP